MTQLKNETVRSINIIENGKVSMYYIKMQFDKVITDLARKHEKKVCNNK